MTSATTSLPDLLCDPARRDEVVSAMVGTIEQEVAGKSGVTGLALKTALKAVQKINPDLIRKAVNGMLPDMAAKLNPIWADKGAVPFGEYLPSRSDEAADALLSVSDERASRPDNKALAKIYGTVRPKAKAHVVEALPAVGRTIDEVTA